MARNKILIVDDESGVRFGIRDFLEQQGFEVDEADSCQDAQHTFRTSRPDIVIADYMLPDGTALDLIPRLKDIDPDIPLLVLTAHGSIDLAVRAQQDADIGQLRSLRLDGEKPLDPGSTSFPSLENHDTLGLDHLLPFGTSELFREFREGV